MCVAGVQLACVQGTRVWLVCSSLIHQLDACRKRAIDTCADYMCAAYVHDNSKKLFSWHTHTTLKIPLHTCSTCCYMCAAYMLHLNISVRVNYLTVTIKKTGSNFGDFLFLWYSF